MATVFARHVSIMCMRQILLEQPIEAVATAIITESRQTTLRIINQLGHDVIQLHSDGVRRNYCDEALSTEGSGITDK